MEEAFDANVPDTTNGDYFCRLCLASANSEGMWKSHIAGKRHLRNMEKYPNGLPRGYVAEDDEDESYDGPPPKYGRYENDEWRNYPPRVPDMYPRTWDYVPEVRPQITIDYGHKKTLPEAQSLMDETMKNASFSLLNASSKDNYEDPIIKLLTQSKFILNKFEEESTKQKLGAIKSALDSSNKNAVRDDDFEKELDELLGKSSEDSKQNDQSSFSADSLRKQINDILQGKGSKSGSNDKDDKSASSKDSRSNSDRKIPSKTNSANQRYSNDKKHLDKDTRKYDRNSDRDRRYEKDSGKNKRYRDSDRDKKKYDKDDKNKKKSDRDTDRGRSYRYSNRRKRSRSSSSSSSSSSSDSNSSDSSSDSSDSDRRRKSKISDKKGISKDLPKTKIVVDKEPEKRINNKTDDSIFLDAFHKLNDKKLFDVPDTEEPTSSSSWKKSTKVDASNLDSIDPDKMTPDSVDDLLNSYLKPKTNSSVEKGLNENSSSQTATVSKPDNVETIAEKLENLPTKSFFQIVLKKLETKNLIKDGDDLKMLLKIISQGQEVVTQNLPSSVQAMLKSKRGMNDSKTTPVSAHSPSLSANYVTTAVPMASQQVPNAVVQAIAQPAVPTIIQPNAGVQAIAQPAVPTVIQPILQPVAQQVAQPVIQPVVQPVLQPVVQGAQPVIQALTQPSLPSVPPEVRQLLPSQFLQAVSQAIAMTAHSQAIQTTAPTVPQAVPKSVPQPSLPPVSTSTSVYGSQAVAKSTSRHLSPSEPRKPPEAGQSQVSKSAPQRNSENSPTPKLDSFEKVIAWQNYLASMQGASKNATLTTANSVNAYQNYLKSLESSKQKATGADSVPNVSSSKATLPVSTNKIANPQSTSQTASPQTSAKPPSAAENPVKDRVSFEKFLSTINSASAKAPSPSPSPNSSKNQSAAPNNAPDSETKSKWFPMINPSEPVSGSRPASIQNQNAWQNNQKNNFANFCSQMYSLLMNNPRMAAPNNPAPSTTQTVSTQPSPVSQSMPPKPSSTSQPSALNSSSVSQPPSTNSPAVPQPPSIKPSSVSQPSRPSPASQPSSRSSPASHPTSSKSSPASQPSSRSSPASHPTSSKSSSESPRYAPRPSSESSRYPPRPPFEPSRYGPRPSSGTIYKPPSLRHKEQSRYSNRYSSRR